MRYLLAVIVPATFALVAHVATTISEAMNASGGAFGG